MSDRTYLLDIDDDMTPDQQTRVVIQNLERDGWLYAETVCLWGRRQMVFRKTGGCTKEEEQSKGGGQGCKGRPLTFTVKSHVECRECGGWPILNFVLFAKFRVGILRRTVELPHASQKRA
jgi:hypothetical protein